MIQLKWLGTLVLAMMLTTTLPGQLIGVKSVPVATGDQFLMVPSQNMGMGGVSIALDDALGDPFRNPAKGMLAADLRLLSAPAYYSISDNNGNALTLPMGLMLNRGSWFGGFAFAAQRMKDPDDERFNGIVPAVYQIIPQESLTDMQQHNLYASGFFGKPVAAGTAVGIGFFYASIEKLDGVDLLYPNSQKVVQSGDIWDVRAGLWQENEAQRAFEAVVVYNHSDITHDVYRPVWWTEDALQLPLPGIIIDHNRDRTRTLGVHFGYRQPLNSETGWHAGGILTVNRKDHPKIPNYELMNIPRDPGTTWAFNTGVGLARVFEPVRFAVELIFEPVWSHTWANAESDIWRENVRILPAGAKTVENHFEFTNWIFRMGLEQHPAGSVFGVQLGLDVKHYQYWLDQDNYVEGFSRSQRESWTEWSPRASLRWRYPAFQLAYTIKLIAGTGRPGLAVTNAAAVDNSATRDILLAPAGALALEEAIVLTHQLSFVIPIN